MQDSSSAALQETLLGNAVAAAGAGVLVHDDTLRYVAANSAACKLLGYTRDQLLELRVHDVVESPNGGLVDAAREVIDGKIRHGTASVRRKDGESFPAQYVSAPAQIDGLPHGVTFLW